MWMSESLSQLSQTEEVRKLHHNTIADMKEKTDVGFNSEQIVQITLEAERL